MLSGRRHALRATVWFWVIGLSACSAGSVSVLPPNCQSGDSSLTCCIKKFPVDPVGACGATASDIETALRMASRIDEDDFANNASLPDWKQWCIKFYVRCINHGWRGPCDDCLRSCEGQQDWLTEHCFPPKKRK